jgi:hypothetical protein
MIQFQWQGFMPAALTQAHMAAVFEATAIIEKALATAPDL